MNKRQALNPPSCGESCLCARPNLLGYVDAGLCSCLERGAKCHRLVSISLRIDTRRCVAISLHITNRLPIPSQLQQVLKQPKNDNTGNVSLSPSDEDDDEEENGGDDAQVDLVKAPVFKVPQERLLRTPPSARNIPQGAKLTHHVDAKAVLSKNSGANLTHRDKLRRQSIQAHSTPARSVKPQTRHSTTTPQVPR